MKEKIKRNKEGKFPGVFIAAKKIINNGEISSKGPGYRTEVITEDYEGTGSVKSEDIKYLEEGLFQKWLIPIIIGVIVVAIGLLMQKFLF